jgi:large conductance mechanosensitive channel
MLKEFKDFAMKGSLIEIAVALVMAIAFGAVVASLVEHVIMPIVGIIFGEPNFDSTMIVTINDSQIRFGSFVQALVVFLATAAGVYFLVVKPYNAYKARQAKGEVAAVVPSDEIKLLTEIRDSLRRS